MTKAAQLFCIVCLSLAPGALGQDAPADVATDEAVRRQEGAILLRKVLADAAAAQQKGEFDQASKAYEDAYQLVVKVRVGIEEETRQTVSGLATVRMELARRAQRRSAYQEAELHVNRVLAVDPQNVEALKFKKENDKALEALKGRLPSQEVKALLPETQNQKERAGTLVQDGKLLYEMGRLDEAEAKLKSAVTNDPSNQAAYYYLKLIAEARYQNGARDREVMNKDKIVEMEKAWLPPTQREALPTPNPKADVYVGGMDIHEVHTGPGRNAIQSKLHRIILNEVVFEGLSLPTVLTYLSEQALQRDPEKQGINFLINPNVVVAAAPPPLIDPTTGAVTPAPMPEPLIMDQVMVRISPAMRQVRLIDLLEAVVKVASAPIKYTVEEYAVVISQKPPDAVALETRIFKVDPNTFVEGLQAVGVFPLGSLIQSSGSTGGGGGGFGGGGGGVGGGGGGIGGGGGGGVFDVPRVYVAGGGGGGFGGGGGGFGGGGGGIGGGGTGGGLPGVTSTNMTQASQDLVRAFFTAAGVNMLPPNQLYFNDRRGILMVRATSQELDIIQKAIEVLNVAPPQLTIEAKFVEVGQNDTRELGFDWFLGNTLARNGSIGWQGGTAPSFAGAPSPGNPSGVFPGSFGIPSVPPTATDGEITSGLRNNAPSIFTLTGILTQPQFRVVIHAIENREGTDLMAAPKVTTLSGRQTQIQVVEIRSIVAGNSTGFGGGGGAGGAVGGVGGTAVQGAGVGVQQGFTTTQVPLGPTLDVLPYVSADGYSVQMTIIPSIIEFIGYDEETARQFIPQVTLAVGNNVGAPITSQLPLPIFRARQVVTSCNVWDGQTAVLGGLLAEDVSKTKDKIPILGDLPLVGRLFRSESSKTRRKNMLIFVTPTIIDPAGNPVHTPDNLPYDPNATPPQMPIKQ